MGADFFATGRYAKIVNDNGIYKLYISLDKTKDQLYFLYLLNQEKLSKTLFPLSNYKKSEIKAIAQKYDLLPKSSKERRNLLE